MTKWLVQKQIHTTAQQHGEHQDATAIQKKTFLCFFRFFYFYLLHGEHQDATDIQKKTFLCVFPIFIFYYLLFMIS